MNATELLTRGHEAMQKGAWPDAFDLMAASDRENALGADDLQSTAVAALLSGQYQPCFDFWTRAHYEYLRLDQLEPAVNCGAWLALGLLMEGEHVRSNGWLVRSHRLLADAGIKGVQYGFLLMPGALQYHWRGDVVTSLAMLTEAAELAREHQNSDLMAMSLMGIGDALLRLGRTAEGLDSLDEAMTLVWSGRLSLHVVGLVYCVVIGACQRASDLQRAKEWTSAFTRWCEDRPEVVTYRSDCLVYRAEIMRLGGAWPTAVEEVERACDAVNVGGSGTWAGSAFYQLGELRRLRGEFDKAEDAYRQANERGRPPQPGLALMRLAQGRRDAAVAAIARTLVEAAEPSGRSQILAAHVEIMLAAGDIAAARASAEEMERIAVQMALPLLAASSAQALGAVSLAEGDAAAALGYLRKAIGGWHELEVPYEAARCRVLIAKTCRALGDEEGAELEENAARAVFEQLSAATDLQRLDTPASPIQASGGLTVREAEVLRLVAAGKSNRAIAGELVLSEKTVARHVSNIFTKLNISSRAAATGYAYEHDLT